jgi:putative RNA 2'-phosphotransferase
MGLRRSTGIPYGRAIILLALYYLSLPLVEKFFHMGKYNFEIIEIKISIKTLEYPFYIVILIRGMEKDKRKISISKFMALALRHSPEKFGLNLDPKGFVLLNELLRLLQKRFGKIDLSDIQEVVYASSKSRFEITGDKIRARYGHSLKVDLDLQPFNPPQFLYHGTAPHLVDRIEKEGLKPMKREYVHLSKTVEEAISVSKRKSKNPSVLKISAREAQKKGILFFDRGSVVVVKYVPPEFLESLKRK